MQPGAQVFSESWTLKAVENEPLGEIGHFSGPSRFRGGACSARVHATHRETSATPALDLDQPTALDPFFRLFVLPPPCWDEISVVFDAARQAPVARPEAVPNYAAHATAALDLAEVLQDCDDRRM